MRAAKRSTQKERFSAACSGRAVKLWTAKMPTVPEASNSRKFVAASRVAGRYAGRSRTLSAARSAISTVVHSLWKVFHRLWHEVMGFVFFIFALIGALAAYREYRKYALEAPHPSASHWMVAAAFALMFLYFSVSSFWRARAGVKFKGTK
jgi:hypothetical protein